MESIAPTRQEDRKPGELLAAVSNRMVRLLREGVGRGPTKCKTHWAGPDMLVVVLSDGYLPAEKTLLAAGRVHDVRSSRAALQDVLGGRMCAAVEELVGRPVVAFMSTQNEDPDIQVELFAFEPEQAGGGPSENERLARVHA